MRRTPARTIKPRTETCPKCGEDIILDNPIVNGDDNDLTQIQGTCDCGYEVSEHADEYEPDYEPED